MTNKALYKIQSIVNGKLDYVDDLGFLAYENEPPMNENWNAIFRLFESNPIADFGSPGPAVHYIEKSFPSYVDDLIKSIHRSPTMITIWMLNRIINGTNESGKIKAYLEVLIHVTKRENIDNNIVQMAKKFIELHTLIIQ